MTADYCRTITEHSLGFLHKTVGGRGGAINQDMPVGINITDIVSKARVTHVC